MPNNILKNFTNNYKAALVKAISLAWQQKTDLIKPEFLLYGILCQKGSLGFEILQKTKLSKEKLGIAHNNIESDKSKIQPMFDSNSLKIIEKSANLAFEHNHPFIATEHLLLAIIECLTPEVQKIFSRNNVNINFLKTQIKAIFNSTSKFQNFTSNCHNTPGEYQDLSEIFPGNTQTNALATFTTDLTDAAIQKTIDPVIGRDKEISRLIEILLRRNKNNPLILGEPGVGKTAIVEGLAKKIINKEVPQLLLDKRILALDIAQVVAGTMFRGEFENRMKQILTEIKKDPNIIIFIDEIHNIIGAGSTQGSMDVANILKPALARGEIRCIGATTYEEYKKHLENDPALERRFQVIKVKEPNAEETQEIIKGIKSYYENFHQVIITDQAILAAVELSQKYLNDRFFPDKAIDLIDESASRIKVNQKLNPLIIKIKELETQLAASKTAKDQAILRENFKEAILIKSKENELIRQISLSKEQLKDCKNLFPKVGKKEICQIISNITNIPVDELLMEENTKLLNLENLLKKHIIGQDTALKTLSQTIRRSKSGVLNQEKPLGSFIFIGPSGTGKTHTAKILSQILFDNNPEALIKIDMSEFSEKFNISKLIGAPAGYVGYKENSKLADAVRRNPNAVVLFDEIEKAHADVFNLLLQILDEGYLTDASGKKINFRNTVIIMTSNIGTEKLNKLMGFDKQENNQEITFDREVKNFFKPEFINRVDKIIYFNKLTQTDLQTIIKIELDKLSDRLAKKNLTLQYCRNLSGFIMQSNNQQEKGARFVRQNIEDLIANPLSDRILQDSKSGIYKISVKNKKIQIA